MAIAPPLGFTCSAPSGLPEGGARDTFISSFASGLAQNSMSQATNFVRQLPAGDTRDRATLSVVTSWANNDPLAAAAWAVTFPAGDTRYRALQNAVSRWADCPGATPALASRHSRPASARLRNSLASSTTLSPTEKRGRIG